MNIIITEDDIPVCQESNYEEWEDEFFAQLGPLAKKSTEDLDEELDDEDNDIELPMNTSTSVVKITSYLDAIEKLESVQEFLELKGHTNAATSTSALVSSVVDLSYSRNANQQSLITDYFRL